MFVKMKGLGFSGLLVLFAVGCSGADYSETVGSDTAPNIKPKGFQIELRPCDVLNFPGGVQTTTCAPSPGFVSIGGAARVGSIFGIEQGADPGALLTAMKPLSNGSWQFSAKDHYSPSNFALQAMSIGLHMDGEDNEVLKTDLHVYRCPGLNCLNGITPVLGHYNVTTVVAPENEIVLGGGGECPGSNGQQLLFRSMPYPPTNTSVNARGWSVGCKDHIISDLGLAIAYVVTINRYIGAPFQTSVSVKFNGGPSQPLAKRVNLNNSTFGTLSAIGIDAQYDRGGWGRMASGVWPSLSTSSDGYVTSKDHIHQSSGITYAYGLYLQ